MKEVRALFVLLYKAREVKRLWRSLLIYSVYQQTRKVYSAQRYKAQSCKSSSMVQNVVTREIWLWLILKFNIRQESFKI